MEPTGEMRPGEQGGEAARRQEGRVCPKRAFLHSTIPQIIPRKQSLCVPDSRCQRHSCDQDQGSSCPQRARSGRETENKINRCVVCQAGRVIRAREGAEGERSQVGAGCVLVKLQELEHYGGGEPPPGISGEGRAL